MTYTFKCSQDTCPQEQFTIEQSMKDALPSICPKCGGKIIQVFSAARITWNDKDICGKINKS